MVPPNFVFGVRPAIYGSPLSGAAMKVLVAVEDASGAGRGASSGSMSVDRWKVYRYLLARPAD